MIHFTIYLFLLFFLPLSLEASNCKNSKKLQKECKQGNSQSCKLLYNSLGYGKCTTEDIVSTPHPVSFNTNEPKKIRNTKRITIDIDEKKNECMKYDMYFSCRNLATWYAIGTKEVNKDLTDSRKYLQIYLENKIRQCNQEEDYYACEALTKDYLFGIKSGQVTILERNEQESNKYATLARNILKEDCIDNSNANSCNELYILYSMGTVNTKINESTAYEYLQRACSLSDRYTDRCINEEIKIEQPMQVIRD